MAAQEPPGLTQNPVGMPVCLALSGTYLNQGGCCPPDEESLLTYLSNTLLAPQMDLVWWTESTRICVYKRHPSLRLRLPPGLAMSRRQRLQLELPPGCGSLTLAMLMPRQHGKSFRNAAGACVLRLYTGNARRDAPSPRADMQHRWETLESLEIELEGSTGSTWHPLVHVTAFREPTDDFRVPLVLSKCTRELAMRLSPREQAAEGTEGHRTFHAI